jgi:UDP-2-acetamido-2,6-beta-L-arabino-hexul-4-ose reductase
MIRPEKLPRFTDERGFVFEPIEEGQLPLQKNAHVVVSRPGAVRGNHYHLLGAEVLAVCGPALIRIRENDEIYEIVVDLDETCRLVIPPGISHAIKNTGTMDNLLVAFNTQPHDPEHPDTVPDILIE